MSVKNNKTSPVTTQTNMPQKNNKNVNSKQALKNFREHPATEKLYKTIYEHYLVEDAYKTAIQMYLELK